MKQMLLILNPTSGMKKAARNLTEIISVFNRAGYVANVYVTAERGDAVRAVQNLGGSAELIVCCGGDGTLNETVTGLMEAGLDTPIGYIPAGSTNDFAGSLHLSSDVIKAAGQIAEGKPTPYDIGKWGERYFTYIASFGAFTKASYATPQNMKNALGHLAYILEGIQELSGIRTEHIRMELDNEVLEDDYLFGAVCNSTSVGGILTLNPNIVDMSDGRFEVFLIRAPRNMQELHECILALTNQTYNCKMITFRSAGRLKITCNSTMPWSLDGERAEGKTEITVENLHHRIRIVH
ncbi:MAG: YegS/Rv2252/BmrU family lipid kinase [Ruminococcaceae bacterium]|nr:YegS/Rv2252/BmrU family lipid kinase [Oscillospiraceae bacterium]